MERQPLFAHPSAPELESLPDSAVVGSAHASHVAKRHAHSPGATGRKGLPAGASPFRNIMVRRGSKSPVRRVKLNAPEVSFIIPLFNTGDGLARLFEAFETLELTDSWELVLVDDGSTDGTARRAAQMMSRIKAPVILVELARNFGEHAAVLEGCRHAHGECVICLDDDLQNPVIEAVKLLRYLQQTGAEVVYSFYDTKRHHWFRNLGSRFTNHLASWLLGKPKDLYLSSFRALRRSLVDRIITYRGPYPYIDGLILGATNCIERLQVEHVERATGQSGYTFRKLIRLLMSVLFDFSVMPLRIASVLGVALCLLGMLVLGSVLLEMLLVERRQAGWGSLMGALAVFSGAQLLMLGIMGEYLGRAFLTVSGKPQSLVRAITAHGGTK